MSKLKNTRSKYYEENDMSNKISNVLQIVDPSGLTYYLGTITPAQIMELTFVPCVVNVNEDVLVIRTQQGYQREGDKKRMTQIRDFYSTNTASLIPPVLLSTRGAWKFVPKTANSPFGSIEATDQAAIIDGQHRLGGLSMIAHDGDSSEEALHRNIPFMAVQFDDVKIESDEFEVINGKQKGIKPSHLKYIRKNESFGGNAADMLKEDPDSVFAGRIAIATRADYDLITFKAATDLVAYTFDSVFCQNALRPDTEENQQKAMSILLAYWKAVSNIFGNMWADVHMLPVSGSNKSPSNPGRNKFEYRLLEETGLRAFARLGSNILYKSWIPASADIAWNTVDDHLRKVAQDPTVQIVMQKLKPHNRDQILAIDPKLQMQGLAGWTTLYSILYGALERNN
jgi:DNA sulfur modification protein DndB